ncbi:MULTISPECIES: carboxymuconolactone decarboxylase family protein [Pseudovibrio]|uniref:carboxymuconolactone decarboxylase family protein n=1 Tax=Stappiaceae TaxID=2821832 RepID=UPI00236638E3|nr:MULTISPECIES: carboxymuconolactone decarboxylase family protein [Pseudovibrio]MDD7909382.1 carboxymuconolactone decarboxylase family protein [Pseudovibrio exalbescens]MDX5594941.1 carboxymuconolactone decarboxylase family protein [Pseudovibrio sp. SPO723]
MEPRIDYMKASPDSFKAVWALEQFVSKEAGLDPRLLHLLKIRASQINGCAFCIDMHVKEARKDGLGEQWIALISAWQESPLYDERERAVLAWTESLTTVSESGAPDAHYEMLKPFFSEDEITKLTVAIGTINVWNRIAIAFRVPHPVDPTN